MKTWFDQPAKRRARRIHRFKKARQVAPRPAGGLLRSVVRCPTQRYNRKVRAGRGFSMEELKQAGINKKLARTVGIAVDHRRRNKSMEGLQANVQRLKEYRARLILFPRKKGKRLAGEAGEEDIKVAQQLKGKPILPIQRLEKSETGTVRPISEDDRAGDLFWKQRQERVQAKLVGKKEKRAKQKAEEDDSKKGKG